MSLSGRDPLRRRSAGRDRARRVPSLLACALVLSCGTAVADFEKIERTIAEEKAKVAQVWLGLAEDLAGKDQKAAATDAVARARAADPEAKGLAEAASRVQALPGRATEDDATRKRVEKARKEAAKCYERMAEALAAEKQDARHADFLVQATGLDPTKARVKVLADMAIAGSLTLRAPDHPFAALVSLPKAWKPGKEWHVLVCIEGESAQFAGTLERFRAQRRGADSILVVPYTLSSSEEARFDRYPAYPEALVRENNSRRLAFDEEGLLPLLDFLRAHFGAAERFSLTGFSKGGLLACRVLARRPGRVRCLALACTAFEPEVLDGAAAPPEGGPPVVLLVGEKAPDRAALDANAERLAQALGELGYAKVQRDVLPDAGRSDFAPEVWNFAWLAGAGR